MDQEGYESRKKKDMKTRKKERNKKRREKEEKDLREKRRSLVCANTGEKWRWGRPFTVIRCLAVSDICQRKKERKRCVELLSL